MKAMLATILIAVFAVSACSRTRPEASAQHRVGRTGVSETAMPVYAPIDANAKEGEVFEYY